ncbi:MAG: GntR family transcriptional regulator [Acidobacteria bacterium]|nr:GntR family transcriptional regulator [Acidobacteriota bacterium]MBI3422034.1 GntR family transcriptional regulator [Acidobacteriota bacterium]
MATAEPFIINKARISDQVYDYLRGEILTGRFAPGQRLNLEELVERLKISKMPVKEAIGRLAVDGLLDVQAQRGTFVSRVDPRELQETFAVRCALEVLAGELAVERIKKADLEKLSKLIAEMEQSTSQTDVGRHLELNFQFHGLLVELADNRKLIEMYHRLRTPIQIAGIHYRSESWVERVAQEQKEHRAIVRALQQKDAGAVARAIREHLKRGGASLLAEVKRSIKQDS